ncbi:Uncharacterised protein [Mycobacteroides abscessus subsp. abscessus]|nr:Uncharacterised protein [Mycobacteroides abscessus subsp. abscessus]
MHAFDEPAAQPETVPDVRAGARHDLHRDGHVLRISNLYPEFRVI